MSRPDLSTVPQFYHGYVNLVEDGNVLLALSKNTSEALAAFRHIPEEKWSYRYAENKWSIKEMVQHIIDTERIFCFRALWFARGDETSLPGFDENKFAAASGADKRNKNNLIGEFEAVRKGTEFLFNSFDEKQLNATGTANGNTVSVNGIGFITAGHVKHHLSVLQTRYL